MNWLDPYQIMVPVLLTPSNLNSVYSDIQVDIWLDLLKIPEFKTYPYPLAVGQNDQSLFFNVDSLQEEWRHKGKALLTAKVLKAYSSNIVNKISDTEFELEDASGFQDHDEICVHDYDKTQFEIATIQEVDGNVVRLIEPVSATTGTMSMTAKLFLQPATIVDTKLDPWKAFEYFEDFSSSSGTDNPNTVWWDPGGISSVEYIEGSIAKVNVGKGADTWDSVNKAPWFYTQFDPNQDFIFEAKINATEIRSFYKHAGVGFIKSFETGYANKGYCGPYGARKTHRFEADGYRGAEVSDPILAESIQYLRLIKQGSTIEFYSSVDYETWIFIDSYSFDGTVPSYWGVVGKSWSDVSYTLYIDWMRIKKYQEGLPTAMPLYSLKETRQFTPTTESKQVKIKFKELKAVMGGRRPIKIKYGKLVHPATTEYLNIFNTIKNLKAKKIDINLDYASEV